MIIGKSIKYTRCDMQNITIYIYIYMIWREQRDMMHFCVRFYCNSMQPKSSEKTEHSFNRSGEVLKLRYRRVELFNL